MQVESQLVGLVSLGPPYGFLCRVLRRLLPIRPSRLVQLQPGVDSVDEFRVLALLGRFPGHACRCHGLRKPSRFGVGRSQDIENVRVAPGGKLRRLLRQLDGLFARAVRVVGRRGQDPGEPAQDHGLIGLESQKLAQFDRGGGVLMLMAEGTPQVGMGQGELGIQRHGRAELRDRRGHRTLTHQQDAEIIVGLHILRIDFQGLLEVFGGLRLLSLFVQEQAQVVVGLDIIGIDLDCAAVAGLGLGGPPQSAETLARSLAAKGRFGLICRIRSSAAAASAGRPWSMNTLPRSQAAKAFSGSISVARWRCPAASSSFPHAARANPRFNSADEFFGSRPAAIRYSAMASSIRPLSASIHARLKCAEG